MILKDMQPRESGAGSTEQMGGSQGSLANVAAPPRPASDDEREKARALGRAAAPGN